MAQQQLTLAQRYEISAYLQANISKSRIAEFVQVHRSTIYREVKRNSCNGKYHAEAAHHQVRKRRKEAAKNKKISKQTWLLIEKLIRLDFSPEQIAGFFHQTSVASISHEWIYQYILADKEAGGTLWRHLRWSRKKRRKRYGKQDRRGIIPDRVSIDQRPAVVDQKIRIGDWEIDTATGKRHKGILIVAVERKSKLTLIEWSPQKKADLVAAAIIRMLRPYVDRVKTITVDNGREFTYHKKIAAALEANVYFAHPYSAWERGLNENTIGLIRQYFPKNVSLANVDRNMIQFVQNRLNIRPRKTLNFQSPNHEFHKTVAFGT
jgi:IS30 family transposase